MKYSFSLIPWCITLFFYQVSLAMEGQGFSQGTTRDFVPPIKFKWHSGETLQALLLAHLSHQQAQKIESNPDEVLKWRQETKEILPTFFVERVFSHFSSLSIIFLWEKIQAIEPSFLKDDMTQLVPNSLRKKTFTIKPSLIQNATLIFNQMCQGPFRKLIITRDLGSLPVQSLNNHQINLLLMNPIIRKLSFYRSLNSKMIRHLAKSMGANETLIKLEVGYGTFDRKGIIRLIDSLMVNTTLENLALISITMDKKSLKRLGSFLTQSPFLTSFTYFGSKFVAPLLEALKMNTRLTTLKLPYCSLNNEYAPLIAEALTQNSTLQILDLHNNYIKDLGITTITSALCTNITLKELDLRFNQVSLYTREMVRSKFLNRVTF